MKAVFGDEAVSAGYWRRSAGYWRNPDSIRFPGAARSKHVQPDGARADGSLAGSSRDTSNDGLRARARQHSSAADGESGDDQSGARGAEMGGSAKRRALGGAHNGAPGASKAGGGESHPGLERSGSGGRASSGEGGDGGRGDDGGDGGGGSAGGGVADAGAAHTAREAALAGSLPQIGQALDQQQQQKDGCPPPRQQLGGAAGGGAASAASAHGGALGAAPSRAGPSAPTGVACNIDIVSGGATGAAGGRSTSASRGGAAAHSSLSASPKPPLAAEALSAIAQISPQGSRKLKPPPGAKPPQPLGGAPGQAEASSEVFEVAKRFSLLDAPPPAAAPPSGGPTPKKVVPTLPTASLAAMPPSEPGAPAKPAPPAAASRASDAPPRQPPAVAQSATPPAASRPQTAPSPAGGRTPASAEGVPSTAQESKRAGGSGERPPAPSSRPATSQARQRRPVAKPLTRPRCLGPSRTRPPCTPGEQLSMCFLGSLLHMDLHLEPSPTDDEISGHRGGLTRRPLKAQQPYHTHDHTPLPPPSALLAKLMTPLNGMQPLRRPASSPALGSRTSANRHSTHHLLSAHAAPPTSMPAVQLPRTSVVQRQLSNASWIEKARRM